LTDFGLSKEGIDKTGGLTESFCGTTEYLAPEMLKDNKYGFSVDWYSLGLVIFEMLSGYNPFKTIDSSYEEKTERILTFEIQIPS